MAVLDTLWRMSTFQGLPLHALGYSKLYWVWVNMCRIFPGTWRDLQTKTTYYTRSDILYTSWSWPCVCLWKWSGLSSTLCSSVVAYPCTSEDNQVFQCEWELADNLVYQFRGGPTTGYNNTTVISHLSINALLSKTCIQFSVSWSKSEVRGLVWNTYTNG